MAPLGAIAPKERKDSGFSTEEMSSDLRKDLQIFVISGESGRSPGI